MSDQTALVPVTSAARHSDDAAEEKCLYVTTTTWSRDSHELFDYEARHVHKKIYFLKRSGRIFRTALEILVIPEGRPLPGQGGDFLLSIRHREGSFTVVPADKNIQATNSSAAIMPKKLWLIVKELPSGTHQLQENDVIKLGRFKLRVKQLVKSGTTLPELRLDDLETPQSIVTPDEAATMQCRICLLDGGTTEDPLVCPCQCKGSIKFVHLDCLRHWINGRLSLLSDESQQKMSFFFKQLHCELCKTPFPSSVILNGEKVQIVYVPSMEPPFIILEHIVGTANRGLHVISMGSRKELKLGRGHESDVRIADVSISRYHATIRFVGNEFILEDHASKFGTLVSLRKLHTIEPTHCLAVQVGRTVLKLSLRRAPMEFDDVIAVPENVSGAESEGDDHATGGAPPAPPRTNGNTNYPADRTNGREGRRPVDFQSSFPYSGNQRWLDSMSGNPGADENAEFAYSQEEGSFEAPSAGRPGEGDFLVFPPEVLSHFHTPLGLYPHGQPNSPSLQYSAPPAVHMNRHLHPDDTIMGSDYLRSSPPASSDMMQDGFSLSGAPRPGMPYTLLLPFTRGQHSGFEPRTFPAAARSDAADRFTPGSHGLASTAPPRPVDLDALGPFVHIDNSPRGGLQFQDPSTWRSSNSRFFQRDPTLGSPQVLTTDAASPLEGPGELVDRSRGFSPRCQAGHPQLPAARRLLVSPTSSDQPVSVVGYGDFPVSPSEDGQALRSEYDPCHDGPAGVDPQSFMQGSRARELRSLAQMDDLVRFGRTSVAAPPIFSHQPSRGDLQDSGEGHLKYHHYMFPPSTESDGSSDESIGGTLRRICEIRPEDVPFDGAGVMGSPGLGRRTCGVAHWPWEEPLVGAENRPGK